MDDIRNIVAAGLLLRLQTSGFGQTVAWSRAHRDAPEAQLCETVLVEIGAIMTGSSAELLRELQASTSAKVLEWSVQFKSSLIQRLGAA